ncbi:hypothetical protein SeLEV6574_g00977 [Synchytrium endobioticum]|uniref:Uncharacterized protein n=1 Tax=Synchytrium endobioticum TaxID=286115 RepID=A0A507DFE5_9FUNG|nr:hypothetical protein SeLEV6574_g00977 [Synchytrium endobioticum]
MTGKSNPVRPMIAFEVEFDLQECDADAFLTSLQPSESSGKTPLYEELVKLLHIRHLELFTHNVDVCRGYIGAAGDPNVLVTSRKCIGKLPHVEHSTVTLRLTNCNVLPWEKIRTLYLGVDSFSSHNLNQKGLFRNLERLWLSQDVHFYVLTDWSWIIGHKLKELVLSASDRFHRIFDTDNLLSLLSERPNLTVLEVAYGIVITHHADVECSLRSLGVVESPSAELYSSRILSKVVDLQISVRTFEELQSLSVCRFSPNLQHLTVFITRLSEQEWRNFYPRWTGVAQNLCANGHNIKSLEILASLISAADLATARDMLKETISAVGPSELVRNITVAEWSDFDDIFYDYDDDELSFFGYDDVDVIDLGDYSYEDLYEGIDGVNDGYEGYHSDYNYEYSDDAPYEDSDDADYE